VLVRFEREEAVVFGWVPARAVTITTGRDIGDSFSNGDYVVDDSPPPGAPPATCSQRSWGGVEGEAREPRAARGARRVTGVADGSTMAA